VPVLLVKEAAAGRCSWGAARKRVEKDCSKIAES
jgi:hypothetical protein